MRQITFGQAANEAVVQEMERDPSVFIYGVGLPDHKRFFGTLQGVLEKFGPSRYFDTPISEDAMTGFGLGAAINGLRPIHVHIRADFLLLAMNQLGNMIASYTYMTGGKLKAPLVIRAVIGRGFGQGAQHSKSLHGLVAHFPGLKVIMPTTPRDAKGLLTAAIRDDNPVVSIEHRWLYWATGEVPEEPFAIPIGQGNVLRAGTDVTIVATSWMNVEALQAADILGRHGISVEVVDPRTIVPLDDGLISASVQKTGQCVVADTDWLFCGFSAEVAARVAEKCFGRLKSPVTRIGFAPTPCPTVRVLEDRFYPNAFDIVRAVTAKLGAPAIDLAGEELYSHEKKFLGPWT